METWLDELQKNWQETWDQFTSDLTTTLNSSWQQVDQVFEQVIQETYNSCEQFINDSYTTAQSTFPHEFKQWQSIVDDCTEYFEAIEQEADNFLTWLDLAFSEPDTNQSDQSPANQPSESARTSFNASAPELNFNLNTSESLDSDWFVPLSFTYPSPHEHPACQGCKHYHGYRYGEHLLVCAMHPYGSDNEHCPDWEGNLS